MSGPSPGSGYTPTFSMPIIGPAPAGADPEAHYAGLTSVGLSATGVDPQRILIRANNHYNELYAMNGGLLRFRPAGTRIRDGHAETAPGGGALVLSTWAVDATAIKDNLPGGMPPPKDIMYLDVEEASVRTALDVDALWDNIPRTWLEHVWEQEQGSAPPAGTTLTQLKTHYLDTAMRGDAQFFVSGGTVIGHANAVAGSSDCAFALAFTNAGDNALSPVPYIRLMPTAPVTGLSSTATYGGWRWEHHPLIAATNSMPVPVDIIAKFEIYDLTTHTYVPIPEGTTIDLMDYEDVLPNEVLASRMANADGVVHFGFARQEDLYSLDLDAGTRPDLFFRVRTGGISTPFAHHDSLPEEWSTKGWKSTNDQDGYYENFFGTQIGAHSAPIVLRIGIDFHVKLLYQSASHQSNQWKPAPPGMPIRIVGFGAVLGVDGGTFNTDENGEVHGVTFEISAGDDVAFQMIFETVRDSSINLGDVTVIESPDRIDRLPEGVIYWHTDEDDADRNNPGPTYYLDNSSTSIGDHSHPKLFRITVNERRVALNLLKHFREWSTVVYRLTNGTWAAMGTWIADYSPSGVSFSYPPGRVNIAENRHWQRDTIVHEMSHQLMWVQADYEIAADFLLGLVSSGYYENRHDFPVVTNPLTAWIEGWADFVALIFTGQRPIVSQVTEDYGTTWISLTSRRNLGNSVEGAFTGALLSIFDRYIAQSHPTVHHVEETENGDVLALPANGWLNASGLSDRFRNLIWGPLRGMRGRSELSPQNFARQVERLNRADWHELIVEFNRFNILMVDPDITGISPDTGAAAGGTSVDITGTDFSVGTEVYFDTVLVPQTQTTVHDSTRITVIAPPGSAGTVGLRVVTSGGERTIGFTYT